MTLLNHFHLTSLSTSVKKATGVDISVLALSLCILCNRQAYIRTFKEVFDALGKVGIPRYVLSFRGNLNYRERKEVRFFESRTGQNDVLQPRY